MDTARASTSPAFSGLSLANLGLLRLRATPDRAVKDRRLPVSNTLCIFFFFRACIVSCLPFNVCLTSVARPAHRRQCGFTPPRPIKVHLSLLHLIAASNDTRWQYPATRLPASNACQRTRAKAKGRVGEAAICGYQ